MKRQVIFDNAAYFANAMFEGNTYYSSKDGEDGSFKYFFDSEYLAFRKVCINNTIRLLAFDELKTNDCIHVYEEVEPQWPDNFRKCLCWVSDVSLEKKDQIGLVVNFEPGKEYGFETDFHFYDIHILIRAAAWKYAVPLKSNEMSGLIWDEIIKNET